MPPPPVPTRSSSRLRSQPQPSSKTPPSDTARPTQRTATTAKKDPVVGSRTAPTPTTTAGRAPWGSRAPTTASKPKVEPSFAHLPRQNSSSSTSASISTPSKPSIASKFFTAANASVRKMAPALSRLGVHPSGMTSNPPKNGDFETIKSYLRIRPAPDGALDSDPYLSTTNDTEVIMSAPQDQSRLHIMPKPAQAYTFTKVFQPEVTQPEYFKATALPLVQNLLNGSNGLVFAYGVTNSGKSSAPLSVVMIPRYTIQGTPTARGVVPRTLDVIFNSIEGLQSKAKLRPSMLGAVELEEGQVEETEQDSNGNPAGEKDDTALKIDKNFTYAVFISYCEIYNEKIYDLLEAPQPSTSAIPRAQGAITESHSSLYLAGLKRKALSLKSDSEGGGKYVAGLREIRVRNREEAHAIITQGQVNRQVFGTLANSVSSRSHGVFTVKLIRIHNGAPLDTSSMQTARLSIVDLAGSERTKNTGNTGDRLKEAGNINKSLMVLGQCMEVLHSNQRKVALGRKPAMVPFRHSKLTEMFQNYFAGDGRAVMMIHVNPYDTGFEENTNVMKFSAVARDIGTITYSAGHRFAGKRDLFPHSTLSSPAPGRSRPAIPSFSSSGPSPTGTAVGPPKSSLRTAVSGPPGKRSPLLPSQMSTGPVSEPLGAARVIEPKAKMSIAKADEDAVEDLIADADEPAEVEGLVDVAEGVTEETEQAEEGEEEEEETDDEDEPDALVEHLFDVIKDLRVKVFELELRCASIETDTRDELTRDMQKRISDMERMFAQRLIQGTTSNEILKNKQIDLVQRSVMKPRVQRFATPETEDDEDEESEMENSMTGDQSDFLEGTVSDTDSPSPAIVNGISLGKRIPPAPNFGELEDSDEEGVDEKAVDASFASISLHDTKTHVPESEESDLTEIEDEEDEEDSFINDEAEPTEDEAEAEETDEDSSFNEREESSPEPSPIRPTPRKPSLMTPTPSNLSSPIKKSRRVVLSDDEAEAETNSSQELPTPEDEEKAQPDAGTSSISLLDPPGSPDYVEPIKKKKRKLGGTKILTEEEILSLQSKSVSGGDIKRMVRSTSGRELK